MNNLPRYKKVTKIKLILMCLATLLPILIVSSLEAFIKKQFGITFLVLRYLVFSLCELSIILKIIHYILILKNEDYCLKVYTKINDERNIFIRAKTHSFTIKTILFINAILLIVFGFIEPLVFIVLASESLLIVIILIISAVYYNKKY